MNNSNKFMCGDILEMDYHPEKRFMVLDINPHNELEYYLMSYENDYKRIYKTDVHVDKFGFYWWAKEFIENNFKINKDFERYEKLKEIFDDKK